MIISSSITGRAAALPHLDNHATTGCIRQGQAQGLVDVDLRSRVTSRHVIFCINMQGFGQLAVGGMIEAIGKCARGMSQRIDSNCHQCRCLTAGATCLDLLLGADLLGLGESLDVARGLGGGLAVADGAAQESVLWQTTYGVDIGALESCRWAGTSTARRPC